MLGGARLADERGAPEQRERGPEFIVVLVSAAYDGMPWLERVYQAGALWDALEMGAGADVHCYTPIEFERKRVGLRVVRDVAEGGLDLLHEEPPSPEDDLAPPPPNDLAPSPEERPPS